MSIHRLQQTQAGDLAEPGQDRPVVMGQLGEPDPGIDDDRRRVDARRRDRIDPLPELVADLAHDVLIDRPLLHIAAGPARVHDRVGHRGGCDQPGQLRV